MSNTTITLQTTVNLARTTAELRPLAGVAGFNNEPALSLCNDAIAQVLTFPNDFKFNRIEMPMLVTCPNRQDYLFAGATAFTLGPTTSGVGIGLASTNAITESGNIVTVNFLEPCRFAVGDTLFMSGNSVGAYNSTFTDDGSTSQWSNGWTILTVSADKKTVTFTHSQAGLGTSGAPGITNFGWLSSASMVEMNNTSSPQNIRHLTAVKEITPWSKVAHPTKVCVLKDNGDGTLKIRFYFVPGTVIWGVNLVYQAKAPLKVSLTETWAPFPDQYRAVYTQALLYRMWRHIDSPKQEVEYEKLMREILQAHAADDNEQTDITLVPEDGSLMDFGSY